MNDKRLKVSKVKLVIDVFGVLFFLAVLVGLIIVVLADPKTSKIALLTSGIPVLFIYLSARDLLAHLQARTMIIKNDGIEYTKRKEKCLFEWKDIARISERRKYSGGLTLFKQTGETLLIPFVVEDYNEIRNWIISDVVKKKAEN